jgi:hypothetical protein
MCLHMLGCLRWGGGELGKLKTLNLWLPVFAQIQHTIYMLN